MAAVLTALRPLQASPDAEAVHDLRVAIRRCRSVADIMKEVDPHPAWRRMKHQARGVFQALGDLRDLQVLEPWIEQLTHADDPLRVGLGDALQRREAEPRERITQAVEAFDRKAWRRLARVLGRRGRVVTPDGAAAECLVLERDLVLHRLHARALRLQTPAAWHRLRIGLKKFRYAAEIMLPRRHAAWQDALKQLQDLLGEMHDLYVLDGFVERESAGGEAAAVSSLRQAIREQIQARADEYRAHTSAESNVLQEWRDGLPRGARIGVAASARLRATARAADPRLDRTIAISRLALQVFDALATAGEATRWRDRRLRAVFLAAARLHGVRGGDDRKSRQKAAFDILRALPVPVGWHKAEWETLAWIVRFHRGAEPRPTNLAFSRLSEDRQDLVRGLAGALRLARALHRAGVTAVSRMRDDSSAVVRLRVRGLMDDRKTAGRLADAKHLLEGSLRRVVILEAE